VAAFPLAPLFALINNVLEIRLDAKKLLTRYRRPIPQNVKDIGIWYEIMQSLTRIAVITNAFIIAITSDFIPQLVYKYSYSPYGSMQGKTSLATDIPEICRYSGYYKPPWSEEKYEYDQPFWHIWFVRLVFVVCFQTAVSLCVMLLRYLVPDVPASLRDKIRREKFIINELLINDDTQKDDDDCEENLEDV